MELATGPLPSRAPKTRSDVHLSGPWGEFLERVLPPSDDVEAADDLLRGAAPSPERPVELPAE